MRLDWRLLTVLALAAVSIPVWRTLATHTKAQRPAVALTLPVVAVARVQRQDLYNEVTYLAEFRPFVEVSLHAKVSGYVKEINVDFGDQVKAGQLMAKLEVPELQDELDQAIAAQKRAEADYHVAHVAYTRLLAVDKQNPNLVVQQELDAAEGKDHTTEAAIASAKAEVEKYQTLVGYTRITAPFDGVITHRYADPGSLIQAGTSSDTQSMPLVRVSDNYHLRLDFPVDLPYVKDVHEGDTVEVRVDSLGRTFTGKITRCTHKIDEDTRKMTTEIEVPNPNLELVPGMYATAIQKVDKRPGALSIPIEAVSSEQNPTVYIINDQQEIEERPITLGLITADRYEVKAGLKEGDLVMIGSRAEVKPGEKVTTKVIGSLAEDR
jgi:RND family efflux transporter MFP subunit